MDESKKPKTCSVSDVADDSSASSSSAAGHNLRAEKKAEREKLRRDKLKEQFLELGYALDPNRPKSDKVSILNDTIQMLKDVMNQVDRLKAEYATLSQESRQLIQERIVLREDKAILKSDIEILNAQYHHRVRTMIPHYTYPISVVAITQDKQDTKIKSLDLDLIRNSSNHSDNKDNVVLELELKIHAFSSPQQDVSGKDKKGSSTTTASSSK